MASALRLLGLAISLAVFAASAACEAATPRLSANEPPKGNVVTYSYDARAGSWTKETSMAAPAAGGDSPASAVSNTVIVRLQANTPIREITIDGGFVAGGAEPLFDIDGDPDESGGFIRIGTLTLDTVDARQLEIRDTQVVTTNITNVVAQDNELVLTTTNVTVVFVERGGSSTLSLKDSRVDRIRILGVGGGVDTHLEKLTVTNSGVLGKIRVEDAKIDTLVLNNVSLEN